MFSTKTPHRVLQTEKQAMLQMANDLHLIADAIQGIGSVVSWMIMGAIGAGIVFTLEAVWKKFS
jgi:hypothetical protein